MSLSWINQDTARFIMAHAYAWVRPIVAEVATEFVERGVELALEGAASATDELGDLTGDLSVALWDVDIPRLENTIVSIVLVVWEVLLLHAVINILGRIRAHLRGGR